MLCQVNHRSDLLKKSGDIPMPKSVTKMFWKKQRNENKDNQ